MTQYGTLRLLKTYKSMQLNQRRRSELVRFVAVEHFATTTGAKASPMSGGLGLRCRSFLW
jgi:hypothetical protein